MAAAAQGKAGFGRLWRYNAGEWPFMLIGCIGSFGLGFMMPGMAYCMSTVIAVLYNPDPAQVERQVGGRCAKPGSAAHAPLLRLLGPNAVFQGAHESCTVEVTCTRP